MTINIKNYIKICPKCGSTNILEPTAFIIVAGIFPAPLTTHKDMCKDCRYQGVIPEVEKSKIECFKKEVQNKKSK